MSAARRRAASVVALVVALIVAGVAAAGCGEDPEPGVVEPKDAYTAIVAWQASELGPITTAEGEATLPIIYVVTSGGGTIDVGVQAAVAESVAERATVRFADEPADAFDADTEGAPVHDDGVLLSIGEVPQPARSLTIDVDRFGAREDVEPLTVVVSASSDDAIEDLAPRAEVTDVQNR